MPKRTAVPELMLPLRDPETPAYRWLYAALRGEILAGRLRPGARLPGSRDLASQYGLARGTIVSAFEQLVAEGFLEGTVGSGTYVARSLPGTRGERLPAARRTAPAAAVAEPPRSGLSDHGRRVRPFPMREMRRPIRAFRSDLPALDLFPTALWAQLASRRLRRAAVVDLLGCDPLGYRPLRDAVADYLVTSRGVQCAPEQVAIVSGVQEALDLAARLVLNPGDRVAVEDPGYPGAVLVFAAHGALISPLSVDEEGLELSPAGLAGARLVYVTPAHQFPLGMTMSLRRRLALLDGARSAGALIFEDDYDSEYRYSGRPVPALQGLDRDGLVLFAGSFSKMLFPSLRLGYLVLPPDLVDAFAATRSITLRHPPLLEQTVLCDFIAAGHFGRHLRRMREIYAERLAVLQECVRERLSLRAR